MNSSTPGILVIALLFLYLSGNVFLFVLFGVAFLAYALGIILKGTGKGIGNTRTRLKNVYKGEIGEMEKTTGKYPAGFFDSVGKGVVEKINEYQAPAGAKSYADAQNYAWGGKDIISTLTDVSKKTLEGLGKLFGK